MTTKQTAEEMADDWADNVWDKTGGYIGRIDIAESFRAGFEAGKKLSDEIDKLKSVILERTGHMYRAREERDKLKAELAEKTDRIVSVARDAKVLIEYEREIVRRLVEALRQSLSQWEYHRGASTDDNLDEADHAEAKMFREFKALADLEQEDP